MARDYYTRLKRINAAGIGTITDLFSTDIFKVGGGVATNHPDLVNFENDPHPLKQVNLDEYCITSTPEIEMAEIGDDLELLGAAAAALEHIHS